jgi:LmbE family N-acetylglucosaminyl deacetylase
MQKSVAVIVAHPDDETLWAGGTILTHPSWNPFIVCLCRANDADRAPRFHEALTIYKAKGAMGDVDDGPDQKPMDENQVEQAILELLPAGKLFDLIISHHPAGEYTRHRRHEETSRAVIKLWQAESISADELWTFAYEDGSKKYYPKPIKSASVFIKLKPEIVRKKYQLITETYGFAADSWEARTTPSAEAFQPFTNPLDAKQFLDNESKSSL